MKCAIYIIAINLVLLHQSYGQDGCESHLQECPTWFIPTCSKNATVCKCGDSLSGAIHCTEQSNQSYLLDSYCMTYNCEYNSTYAGKCPFGGSPIANDKQGYIQLPAEISEVNDFMCGKLNRTGLLCSLCRDGLGVATLSHAPVDGCTECWNSLRGWVLYIFLILFPPTLFFLVIVLFPIKLTSAEMNFFIFSSQLMCVVINHGYERVRSYGFISIALMTFYGFWDLDFFRYIFPTFCVSDNLSQIQVIALDYVPALYPLILVILTYAFIELHDRDCAVLVWMWRPFRKCFTQARFLRKLNPKSSVIHTFATFFVMSYSKIIFVSFSLLNFTTIYNETGHQIGPYRMYYNATIPYLSSEHIPFFILTICILTIFIAPFTSLLFLYPTRWFQRCIGCSGRGWHALHAFADVFHGSFKNGTNGTRDYRHFAGLYLAARLSIIPCVFIDGVHAMVAASLGAVAVSLLFALLRPYRKNCYNIFDCLCFAFMALGCQIVFYKYYHVFNVSDQVLVFFGTVPFFYFIVYLAYRAILYFGILHKCMCCLRFLYLKLRNGHQIDREHIDYVFPDRIDNPSRYVDGYLCERNQLQPVHSTSASTYGSI